MKTTLKHIKFVGIPNVHDQRGKLAVIEKHVIPFKMQRIYYLFDVPSDAYRGGHAHKIQESVVIALSGSFEVVIKDGKDEQRIMLNKPDKGLYIPTGIWREIENFSSGSVCLVLASTEFEEADYIRDYEEFLLSKRAKI
ncbi:WxcM-like domain-containing protein [Subsaximicrobium wynnwilliamsii]|uniref:WxcM-like domain-containing protein n=1 Tax=Subsaximicrobium wynnwilliamsii TaxID=291179 RepID=A0A5C6ZGB2_9FLAO|nr:FdtA/QdtA family cupin domain-containing protein [Subsaximicrobium wynnwilliamsii]TXD83341.1 WxcM-like domain-containing protein [Subsaximicrobium wynnwilliamsii]TXD89122.1 WxcM-like domain-containing protein [Subsaximicrobium wynnwilliamsii]TXE03365.1 WxcM-like domain-containing protein [Subsaximicrobium wynnwilliamsii]